MKAFNLRLSEEDMVTLKAEQERYRVEAGLDVPIAEVIRVLIRQLERGRTKRCFDQ